MYKNFFMNKEQLYLVSTLSPTSFNTIGTSVEFEPVILCRNFLVMSQKQQKYFVLKFEQAD